MSAARIPPLKQHEEAMVQDIRLSQLMSSAALLRRHGHDDLASALCHEAAKCALKVLALGGRL